MSGFICSELSAQDVRLHNPSFEDKPKKGGEDNTPIKGWFDCGTVLFPGATPPDIHQGSSYFWENTLSTAHGKTYITIVVREDDSYESVSQKMIGTLKAGQCYSFSISLARSEKYMSATKYNDKVLSNFNQPAVLRIYGGHSTCDTGSLLAESKPVDNTDWEEYVFKIEPTENFSHITFEAFFKTPTLFGYNGNVCMDNGGMFREIDCDEEAVLVAEVEKDKPKLKVMPSFKKKKKKDPTVYVRPKKEESTETTVFKKPKILNLDRGNMELGKLIKLEKLYFAADTSKINVESFQVLNEIYDFLDKYNEITVEVGGHTNSVCRPESYCDDLSNDRAKAVANYLIKKGIEDERVTFKGYGKQKPIATNATPSGRKKNQRVQIMITGLDYGKDGE